MNWFEATSEQIGNAERMYSVTKYPIRRQWSLSVTTPDVTDIAAYFRSEEQARLFAETFGLTITDHREDHR